MLSGLLGAPVSCRQVAEAGQRLDLARAVLVIPRVLDGELLQSQGLSLTEYSVLINLSEDPAGPCE